MDLVGYIGLHDPAGRPLKEVYHTKLKESNLLSIVSSHITITFLLNKRDNEIMKFTIPPGILLYSEKPEF